ncbi:hypothetical protein PS9374_01443 [Planomonospora sphaerica]|uniref:Uncharacterized protein n=1 Tax=Planomonospora sphaerica TaxID=161355 RepID=A0A171BYP0_9ACTN|nr:hypothetical protein [Planomonospora sphaerica]GAT65799.1 hypothetical protein PS9374_01443 [Planomonospora sphaerica]
MVFDRRPGLAFAAGALILAGLIALPVVRPLWPPALTLHVLGGAVVAADVVIVPAVLGRVPPALRMTWGSAGAGGGVVLLTSMVLVYLPGADPYLVETASDASYLGLLGGLVAGGAVMLMATAVLVTRNGRAEHVGGIEERAAREDGVTGGGYVAVCDCGWEGSLREDSSQALVEAGDHASRVRLRPGRPGAP